MWSRTLSSSSSLSARLSRAALAALLLLPAATSRGNEAPTTTPEPELAKQIIDRLYQHATRAGERATQLAGTNAALEARLLLAEAKGAALSGELTSANARLAQLAERVVALSPITVKVGESIAVAVAAAKPGDVVRVEPGHYVADAPIKVPAGVTLDLSGVTIDGNGRKSPAVTVGAGATLRKGTITRFAGENERDRAVVRIVGDDGSVLGTTVSDVQGCAIAWNAVQRPTIADCTVRDVTGSAILGGGSGERECLRPVVARNTFERYNTDKLSVPRGPGVNKFTRTVEATFTDNVFRDGYGCGIWLDIGNRKPTIAGNTFAGLMPSQDVWDNIPIYLELTTGQGGIIEGNTIVAKANNRRYSASICIAESNGLTVRNNTLDAGWIELRHELNKDGSPRSFWSNYDGTGRRETPVPLRDILIADNVLKNGAKAKHFSSGTWPGVPPKTNPNKLDPLPDELSRFLNEGNIVWRDNVSR